MGAESLGNAAARIITGGRNLKIILVVGWYFPDSSGGSEVYVGGLARELTRWGHQVLIVAPHDKAGEFSYEHDGIRVYRYPSGAGYLGNEMGGSVPMSSVEPFFARVMAEKPDLVHFHSWTRGVNYWHFRRVHEAGLPVYFTIHTASSFCARVTMWRWDRRICDGQLRPVRCAACYFHTRGLRPAAGLPLAAVAEVCPFLKHVTWGRPRTAMLFPHVLRLRGRQLRETWQMCRRVVAVCEWVRDSLLLNGCPPGKVLLNRQGCDQVERGTSASSAGSRELRIGFLGRLDHVKGVMILVEAFQHLSKSSRVRLELKGIPQDQAYLRRLMALIGKDERVRLLGPSPPDHVREWLGQLDVLVVPSRWMETGPLVIYEAFAAGIPVIGARHGGIRELVRENENGLLFEPQSSEDLARVLRRVCDSPEILANFRRRIGRTRSMRDVAGEMDRVYRQDL